ncbi:MAG: DUF2178 domain-containing protein [Clostridiales bacterium]|nr:DUF2178 domain-containing protein [Clostridiales bacterium]
MKKRIIFVLLLPVGMFLLLFGIFAKDSVLSGALVGVGTIVLGLSGAGAVPVLARKDTALEQSKIDWQDERNKAIREKASWYTGIITIVAMGVSALVLTLIDQLVGACVIVGLLLLYSVSIIFFSVYFSKKL